MNTHTRGPGEALILECLREIYHQIPKDRSFALSGGRTGRIKAYYPPRRDADGDYSFGLDVRLDGGAGHIEFTMCQTGWGTEREGVALLHCEG